LAAWASSQCRSSGSKRRVQGAAYAEAQVLIAPVQIVSVAMHKARKAKGKKGRA